MTTQETKKENLIERPPVVAVMGHIDHGKSTLLDTIRKTNITKGEAGGITQHIGAYEVLKNQDNENKKITFLDTPGHEAFCSVRERGALIADIAILIVSAEDGVKPQTLEAFKCIKESNTPFIVAINKIDSPKANIDLTKASLIENEIYLEGMGGNISYAEISATEGTGIDDLLDLILLTAEVEDFKADKDTEAAGFVVETHKDKTKGISATLILKNGTLRVGDFIATVDSYSPIRAILDQNNKQLKEVSFSTPFTISGFTGNPKAGDEFKFFQKKKDAEEYLFENKNKKSSDNKDEGPEKESAKNVVPLIIKGDVIGSVEAIQYELNKINIENLTFKVIKAETGDISEADAQLALTNENSLIAGFNVKIDNQAKQVIERNGVFVKTFNIIYEVTKWIEEIAKENKPKELIEEEIGKAKVLKVFGENKKLKIIGGKVKEGKIEIGAKIKLFRKNEEIDSGIIKGLQKSKQEATLILEGEEFGSAISIKTEIAENDMLYAYQTVEK